PVGRTGPPPGPAPPPCSPRARTGCGGGTRWRRPSSAPLPLAGIDHDVVVGGSGRDHGVDLLALVGPEVDDHGSVVYVVGLLDGGLDLLGGLDPQAHAAHGLGPLDVVGEVGREIALGVALL